MVMEALLKTTEEGLGDGETPIFPKISMTGEVKLCEPVNTGCQLTLSKVG